MKKIVICFAFSATLAALTSCGKIEKEPAPDRTINKLTTSTTTTAVTSSKDYVVTTTVSPDIPKIKKLSFSDEDEADEKSIPLPVETSPVMDSLQNRTENKTSANNAKSEKNTGDPAPAATSNRVSDTVTTTVNSDIISDGLSRIVGEWKYQKRIDENQYISDGYVKIENDGSFELCIGSSENTKYGDVIIGKDNFIDGTEYLRYTFIGDDSKTLMECYFMPDNSDILFAGHNGTARLIREDDISNNTEFNPIVGDWEYQELDRSIGEYRTVGSITINAEGMFLYYSNNSSDHKSGNIVVRSEKYSDGKEKYYYAFYEEEKSDIWKSCFCDQADCDIYYAGNGGDSRFVRTSEYEECYDVSIIANHWEYQEVIFHEDLTPEYVTTGYLDIEDDGHYTYTSLDNSEKRYGMIRQECDDEGFQVFAFYDYGQEFWTSFVCDQQDYDRIILDDSGLSRIRCYDREKTLSERFIGTWGYDRCTIIIMQYNDIFVVEIQAEEDDTIHTWHYNCEYDAKEDMLVCNGKGKKEHPDYVRSEKEEEYSPYALLADKISAKFRLEGDDIIWENLSENETTKYPPQEAFG